MNTQQLPAADFALHLAAELDPGHDHATLADQLAEAGLNPAQIANVETLVEREAERRGFHFAAGVVRRIFAHLSGCNSVCAALAHALGLTDRSVTDLGASLGMSKQAVGNLVSRIAPMLGPLAQSKAGSHAITRPAEAGEWLTLPEAAKLTGRGGQTVQSAAKAGELRRVFVGRRGFFEETDLQAWHERTTLTKALEETQPR